MEKANKCYCPQKELGYLHNYSEDYDAEYCPKCNAWLEVACSDPKCNYCSNRPINPVED